MESDGIMVVSRFRSGCCCCCCFIVVAPSGLRCTLSTLWQVLHTVIHLIPHRCQHFQTTLTKTPSIARFNTVFRGKCWWRGSHAMLLLLLLLLLLDACLSHLAKLNKTRTTGVPPNYASGVWESESVLSPTVDAYYYTLTQPQQHQILHTTSERIAWVVWVAVAMNIRFWDVWYQAFTYPTRFSL